MKIVDLSIRYRTSIVFLTIVLVIGGLLSYFSIPKESSPSIEIPNIVVTTIYPGASPDDIESIISQPIEQEIQGINGIKNIRSTSTEGVSTVIVEFDPSVSMDDAFQKVRDKVDIAKAELPSDVEEPLVNEIDFSEFPIMTLNLAADYPLSRLKEVAEDLQEELETIPSVLEVDLIGGLDREVKVDVDLVALQGYNLTFNDVVMAIRNENTNIPGGSVDVDRLNYLVRVDGEIDDPSQIENFVVKAPGGNPIYVRDVADVTFGFMDRTNYARLQQLKEETEDGEFIELSEADQQMLQVISLNVKKRSGDNILETADDVRATLDGFTMPPGTQVLITGDQSVDVVTMVKDLENNIISGLVFVVAVLLFFLGVRNAMLVGVAIPLSMFIAFIVFSVMGQTLNFIILFSLIIALGMLVDNAVVIVENIYRFKEEGHSNFEAARLGTGEVGGAVVASTATTVAAFAPMLFWPGIIGEFMGYMPLTLIITLTCSLFVALIINPVLTGIFIKLDGEKSPERTKMGKRLTTAVIVVLALVLGLANWRTLVVIAIAAPTLYFLHKFALKPAANWFMETGLPRLVARYRNFLAWMLERDYTPKRAMLRNVLALSSFTLGFVFLIVGLVMSGIGDPLPFAPISAAGMLFLLPAVLMLLVGILGILLHSFESFYLGGWGAVKAGGIFGAIMFGILLLMRMGGKELDTITMVELMILPVLIVIGGLVGGLLNGPVFKKRTRLILTDNRARLLTGTLGALLLIIFLFTLAPTGVAFFPPTDPRMVMVTMEAPLGTNIEASNRVADEAQDRIENLLNQFPNSEANVENFLVNVGVGGDAMFGGGAASPERSRLTFNMIDYADRAEPSTETLARLRDELAGIPGVDIEFSQDQNGPPTGAPVNIEVTGEDFNEIVRIAREVTQMLTDASETGAIPGLVDVANTLNTGRPELQVNIDRERAAQFGLSTQQIAGTVRSAINGAEAGKYRTGDEEYDITVRLQERDRESLESLRNLTILYEGQQIPLSAVADFDVAGGLGSVTRLDLLRVATITGDAAPGANGQAVLAQVQTYLSEYQETLPAGYNLSYTGENEEMADAFSFLTTALLIGVALIFMIMVAQFNSVSAPLIIIVAVGLSLVGVLLGLIITRTPFGLFTFIGIISLAGIVVNNSIVLVDYTMQLRDRGMEKTAAVIEGGATRLRPVLLTALTTILGLIPLTFGINIDFVGLLTSFEPDFQLGSENTQFWGPMGTAIISGLTFGTFLTLVIVPVMYSSFDSLALRMSSAFSRKPTDVAFDAAGDGTSADLPVGRPVAGV
ncbi:MAG: efflux RND transporter permease subunit [Rhodothermales bacterium]